MSKDVNNIPLIYVKLSEDIEAFNNFPWGHDNYKLTIKYLLAPLSPETNNLFCFSWDFMAWAFEAIPHLRHQVTTKEEISSLRILTWLTAKNVKNPRDLFNPRDDAIGLVETLFDPIMVRVKTELTGETTIKRARVDDRAMTSMNIWWEDWYIDEIFSLMRERHLRYPENYDFTDSIMDLNFYIPTSNKGMTVSARRQQQGIRPYAGGIDWIGAKRILAVMNMNKTHFVTLEILLHEGRMNVYGCNLMSMEYAMFLTFIQPVFELLPRLLRLS
ncbi:hypothetical protein KY284_035846 [Solanum tuberosum]|nr:hypothetical protein KY284_035846 [Solanum tuberosum]